MKGKGKVVRVCEDAACPDLRYVGGRHVKGSLEAKNKERLYGGL